TGGAFFKNASAIPTDQRHVLMLIRRDVKHCLETLRALKAAGKLVAVSLKESGAHQVAELLSDARRIEQSGEICALADAALRSTSDLMPVYRGAGAMRVEFIPTPYPVDDARWDFSAPVAGRRGIFIGTREFDVPSRNHLAALLAARELGGEITVFNADGRAGAKKLSALRIPQIAIVEGRLPYSEYLRIVARHRIVFQLDRSAVPGQVAGDALLCRVPCVGGDGAIERIAFADLCGHGRDAQQLVEIAARLLRDESEYARALENSARIASETLSFRAGAKKLAEFFSALG